MPRRATPRDARPRFARPDATLRGFAFALLLALLVAPAPFAAAQQPTPVDSEEAPPKPVEEPRGDIEAAEEEGDIEEGDDEAAEAAAQTEAADDDEKEPAWDVDTPPGPAREIAIDVTEGTWMSLDVSPDGEEIVFDLLGDLYTLPIAGGEATALTSGFAWDMQPTYSPDGTRIAFTSDRAGGDNVWTVRRDGSDPTQVTDEDFRLVNSPTWTPDGEFLAVRKHFTSRRSLGAGEIWLYHRSGATGLQMTERPNDQKDIGEPAFSPDGRYLYFSQDTTPGEFFEYNKDPNPGIYTIRRLDRDDGEIVDWIAGAGGAIRPTPSPDGRHVAFIRRVRGESTLWLKEAASGAEWQVADGLDRDMQETWAVHGVYPTMAWTPDSGSLLYWAGGGIQRLAVATGEVAEIPFHVKTTRQAVDALRFPVEVHPETFRTRMLRWVQVSPDGRRALYGALGKIWLKDLPEGEPRRLTRQDDHQELYPSFSRDGRNVVYVSWDDRELGAVRIAPATPGGGAGRVITAEPGHYAEPALSPDGRHVVYRKMSGGFLRSPTWGADPGLYVVPVADGEDDQLTDSGYLPHFGADPERVYYLGLGETADDGPKRLLHSIGLDGRDERTHLRSLNATEFRVSPDGDWVAWSERFNAYVAPLVATGRTIDVGPDAKELPVARVSSDAGSYLHWATSGDEGTQGGSRGDTSPGPGSLYWSHGPHLFHRDLSDAFAYLEGAPEKLPEPVREGIDLSAEIASDMPAGSLVLEGARIVTMAGGRDGLSAAGVDEVIEDGVVVVEGNRITAVGRRGEVAVPAGAHRVDASGKTILPGLVDVHWHGSQGMDEILPEDNWVNHASLAFGVTTLHDPSNDTSEIFTAAEMARAGHILAPRIFSTGTILYGAAGDFKAVIGSYDDALSHLRRMQAVGAISVKSYNQPRREQRQQVVKAARELGMMVVPEGGSLLQHNLNMVADGHTGIEHAVPAAKMYEDVRQFWGATEVGYTPTLVVGYGGMWGENYWYAKTNVWEDERLLSFVPREIVDARSRRRTVVPEEEWGHFRLAETANELHEAGVPVQIGAHGQREGLAAHWELWMLVQGGMSDLEALRMATLGGAWYLGLDGDIGSVEAGKLADLVVVDGNPLEDIRESRNVEWVVLNGRLYDAATLNQVAPEEVEGPSYWWQREGRGFGGLGGE